MATNRIEAYWKKILSTTLLGKVSRDQYLSVADKLLLVGTGAILAFPPIGNKEKPSRKQLLPLP
jgi:hypothetical protein